MTSLGNFIGSQMDAIKQDHIGDWFHCQFCPQSFGVYDEYKAHTFGHFNTRTCSGCNVRLIQICDEWFETHTVANCQSNNHVHACNTNNTNNDNGEVVIVKQEPSAELEPAQLDELLNVKPDVELDDFGEIFAANLNTIEMNENNGYAPNYPQYSSDSRTIEFNRSKSQFNRQYQVVNITMRDTEEKKRTKGFQCHFCDKILFSRFRLDTHMQSHHLSNEMSCNHCGRRFTSLIRLDNHLKRCVFNNKRRQYIRGHPHRPAANFTCDLCGSTLKKFRTLIDHMNEVHSTKFTFKCRICRRLYPNRYYLAKHMNRHKQAMENGQYNIQLTADMDENLMERRKYVRVHPHRPVDDFICDICGKAISRFQLLEEHMSTCHSARDCFQCRTCGRVYPNRYYLQKHMARHKSNTVNDIDVLEDDLDKGLMERNKYNRLPPNKRKEQLTCGECGREFKHYYLLMEHKSSKHSGKNIFECKRCGRKYPNRYYLTKHLKRHEQVDNSGIPEDQLNYDLDKGLMERAKYVRSDPNDQKTEFECDECGRIFKKFFLLTEHKRSKHEFGFLCRKCNRSYPNRYYLAKHMKQHEDKNCEQNMIDADDDFSDGGQVVIERRHNHPHQPKSEFICDFCGMVYKTYDLLQEHMTTNHSSVASFMCSICNKLYSNRSHLDKHIKKHLQKQNEMDNEENKDEEEVEEVIEVENIGIKVENDEQERNEKEVATELDKKRHAKKRKRSAQRRENQCVDLETDLDEELIQRNMYMRAHPHRPKSNFTCDICQKVLSSYYSIKEHMSSKHTKKTKVKHPCPTCKKLFVSKKRLRKHKSAKHPPVPDVIDVTDVPAEVPKTKAETKQMCSICGRLFPDKSKMIAHEKTHFGIMASCHICGKKFQYKNYLRKHIRYVHGNERPFACEIDGCEWRFKYQPCLKRHQARRHGLVNNRNECPICGKEFPDSTYHLKRHLKAHANNTAKEYIPEPKQISSQYT